jgi:uncharacterized OB-fold protein
MFYFALASEAAMSTVDDSASMSAPYVLEFTYQRSTGPIMGRFFSGLKRQVILGARTSSGEIIVPPSEYDPQTGEAIEELVKLAGTGAIKSWTWVNHAEESHPLDKAFAWALIQLDGADTAMIHAIDVDSMADIYTGMRVQVKWREDRIGEILDIECFVPETELQAELVSKPTLPSPSAALSESEAVDLLQAHSKLEYTVYAGQQLRLYLQALAQRRIIGTSCPACQKIYVPPRSSCPVCSADMADIIDVADTGTITSFCVVNIPFEASPFDPPYVAAAILLDGADIPIFHLIREVECKDVKMGMRVRAQWVEDEALAPTLSNIKWFSPTGEPDLPFEAIAEHL